MARELRRVLAGRGGELAQPLASSAVARRSRSRAATACRSEVGVREVDIDEQLVARFGPMAGVVAGEKGDGAAFMIVSWRELVSAEPSGVCRLPRSARAVCATTPASIVAPASSGSSALVDCRASTMKARRGRDPMERPGVRPEPPYDRGSSVVRCVTHVPSWRTDEYRAQRVSTAGRPSLRQRRGRSARHDNASLEAVQ